MLDIDTAPEAKCILDFVERRIKKRLACSMIFTGPPGVGKSYGGLRFFELWYKRIFNEKFPIDHIVNDLSEAILKVKSFKRKGEGILVEELSTLAGRRDSLTRQNKIWNKFLDIARIKQAILIGNCPHIDFIDRHFQMLCQVWIDFLGVNFTKNYSLAKPLMLQTSPHRSEPYHHLFVGDDGYVIDLIYFRRPNEELYKPYDKMKMENFDEECEELARTMIIERKRQLKVLGDKELPRRLQEAWDLKLKGYTKQEATRAMGLKDSETYVKYIRKAKNRLRSLENKPKQGQKPSQEAIS